MDVGTGSGIRAAYAAARGCRDITACDLELEAVLAARRLLPMAQVLHGRSDQISGQFRCVVANLSGSELADALPDLLRLAAPGAQRGAFTALGFRIVR